MKQYPFLNLGLANQPIEAQLKLAACKVIESGRYLHGEQTALLEKEMAQRCNTDFCIGVSNGLDALKLIFRAYKEMGILQSGDKVIVPANTFIASVLSITDNQLVPVLCEPSELTMNLDSTLLDELLSEKVKAVLPVHLYGTPCFNEQLKQFAINHHLLIIEDNAQAFGAKAGTTGLNGTLATGGLGHASGISFYPTKNLGALGDAGAVCTNDRQLAETVKALANYGSTSRYHNVYQGYNCRIDEIQAAMLRVKLACIDAETERRNAIANAYNTHISNPLVTVPHIFSDMLQVWHQYVVRVERREEFRKYLADNGVETGIHYATPPHRQPCYPELHHCHLPVAERMANEVVSLPIAHPISVDDAVEIANIINDFK
ncbi:MAG: DegT/DnrJ/EryC1/StrS family aminotransferase [Sodaliphilus sp.]